MFNKVKGKVLFNETLAPYTSWKVGGKCKILVFPQTIEDIMYVTDICKKEGIPFFVMGNGSNILLNDGVFDGVVINTSKSLNSLIIEEDKVIVESGYLLPKLALQLANNSIGNFSFYAGIPGTVGGAVVMNAGSAGKETKDIILAVTYLNEEGIVIRETSDNLGFGYRKSKFQGRDTIILSVEYRREFMDKEDAVAETKNIIERRRIKFPLNYPSAGSTFKNLPSGISVGKLIEEAGLKGYKIGGAQVSELHGNWIVNTGSATSSDIKELINFIATKIYDDFGVVLEKEVIYM